MSTGSKVCCASLLLALASVCTLFAQSYADEHAGECEKALAFYETNKGAFERAAEKTGFSAAFLFAIVAPEYTQFSYLSDKIETRSLKVLYVGQGRDYANFSIGFFQMKPAFVEALEEYLRRDTALLAKFEKCLIPDPRSRAARVARVERLTQVRWQLEYLALCCALVRKRFPPPQGTDEAELVAFYASAYNAGFDKSRTQIEALSQKAQFPHFSRKKYNYGTIARYFYAMARK